MSIKSFFKKFTPHVLTLTSTQDDGCEFQLPIDKILFIKYSPDGKVEFRMPDNVLITTKIPKEEIRNLQAIFSELY